MSLSNTSWHGLGSKVVCKVLLIVQTADCKKHSNGLLSSKSSFVCLTFYLFWKENGKYYSYRTSKYFRFVDDVDTSESGPKL